MSKKKEILKKLNYIIDLAKISVDGVNADTDRNSHTIPCGLKQETEHAQGIVVGLESLRDDIRRFGR